MNVSKGQHNLQVDVIAVSDYVTEGIIPFAEREYTIHANASTTFYLTSGSDSVWSPTIDGAKSSYAIWKASDPASTPYELLPPSTIAPSENYSVPPLSSLSLKVHLIYGESCSGLIIIKGGSGNDINFRIIDPQGKVYLDFGRISNEKSFHFFTPNRPGNFTLVFDNEFSVFSSKEVDVFSNTYPDNVFEFAGFSITFWVIILVVILLVTSSVALVVWLSRRRQK